MTTTWDTRILLYFVNKKMCAHGIKYKILEEIYFYFFIVHKRNLIKFLKTLSPIFFSISFIHIDNKTLRIMAENVKERIQAILNELEEEVGFNTVSTVMKELGDAYFHKRIWRKKTSKLVEKYPEASPLCDMIDITLFDDNDTAYPRYCKVTATINNEYMLDFHRNNENGDTDASLTFKGGFINFYPKLPTDKILKIMKHLNLQI